MVSGVEYISPVIMTYLPSLSAMLFLCLNGMPLRIITPRFREIGGMICLTDPVCLQPGLSLEFHVCFLEKYNISIERF